MTFVIDCLEANFQLPKEHSFPSSKLEFEYFSAKQGSLKEAALLLIESQL